MTKIRLEQIKDETEKRIIELIEKEGECLLGEIISKLKLGNRYGYLYLNRLLDKHWISNTKNPPYLTLNVEIE